MSHTSESFIEQREYEQFSKPSNDEWEQFKNFVLFKIETEEEKLDVQDANGHIMWNRFREFIEEL